MSFVEDVNNLLNSGEVPNMFPYDERSAIGETVSLFLHLCRVVLESCMKIDHKMLYGEGVAY